MSKVFKDTVTISLSKNDFDYIIYSYGLSVGSFSETEELVIDTINSDSDMVIIEGTIYQKGLN